MTQPVETGCVYCTSWNGEPHDPECPRRVPVSFDTMTCEGCGRTWATVFLLERRCPTGDCQETVCPNPSCHHLWYSAGPVLCKSCGGMNWLQRQNHRIEMWIFDMIHMPARRLWRKWRNR